jgi:hypothetical protein
MNSLWFLDAPTVGRQGSVPGSILGVLFIKLLFKGKTDLAPVLANIIACAIPNDKRSNIIESYRKGAG